MESWGNFGGIVRKKSAGGQGFQRGGKDRDDLFAETPPLEAKRMLFSRAAARREDGRWRKLMFTDVRKAHVNPRCE